MAASKHVVGETLLSSHVYRRFHYFCLTLRDHGDHYMTTFTLYDRDTNDILDNFTVDTPNVNEYFAIVQRLVKPAVGEA